MSTNTMYFLDRRTGNIAEPPDSGGIAHSQWPALPTGTSDLRGVPVRTEGGTGVADTHAIIHKNVADAYSTPQFALTAAVGGYVGLVPGHYLSRTDAAKNLTDDNSAQNLFAAAGDVLTVEAGQTYRFRTNLQITKGVNNVSMSFLFGGTASFTTCVYNAISTAAAAGTAAAANMIDVVVATAIAVQAATTAVNVRVLIEGEFEINAAGTLIPQIQFSGATGSTPVVKVGSFFECWALGANPVVAIGPWA